MLRPDIERAAKAKAAGIRIYTIALVFAATLFLLILLNIIGTRYLL